MSVATNLKPHPLKRLHFNSYYLHLYYWCLFMYYFLINKIVTQLKLVYFKISCYVIAIGKLNTLWDKKKKKLWLIVKIKQSLVLDVVRGPSIGSVSGPNIWCFMCVDGEGRWFVNCELWCRDYFTPWFDLHPYLSERLWG